MTVNITEGWAVRDIGYIRSIQFHVDITFLQHSLEVDPPRILEEDDVAIFDVVSDWGAGRTTKRHVRPGYGQCDNIVAKAWWHDYLRDGNDKEFLILEFVVSEASFLSLVYWGSANGVVMSSCRSVRLIITGEKVQ
jgi:hypothetical protein